MRTFSAAPDDSAKPFRKDRTMNGINLSMASDYLDQILGAAIFDLNGLPKDYFVTTESDNVSWVQTIFQALGLRSLLMSSLQLEGFHHAVINSTGYSAVVVKQHACYTALLVRRTEQKTIPSSFIQWVHGFEPNLLRQNSRFKVA